MLQVKIETIFRSMTNDDDTLRISIYQCELIWENKAANLEKLKLQMQALSGKTDLLVLPEMFTTGFSMNCETLAETNAGNTVTCIQNWSKLYDIAVCGSFIAMEPGKYFNRAYFIDGNQVSFYDKRHLFRMGHESEKYSQGHNLPIIKYKGFNICIQVCYDLRFPVWTRNVANKYDLLIYIANWPESRIKVWDVLLQARAIENSTYVCGVNRLQTDGYGIKYNGHSAIIDYKGNQILSFDNENDNDIAQTQTINKKELNLFREKFPVWKDADLFTIDSEDYQLI